MDQFYVTFELKMDPKRTPEPHQGAPKTELKTNKKVDPKIDRKRHQNDAKTEPKMDHKSAKKFTQMERFNLGKLKTDRRFT